MSDQCDSGAPSELARRYVWLLAELHGGNEFSKDQLWCWLLEAEAVTHRAEICPTPSAA